MHFPSVSDFPATQRELKAELRISTRPQYRSHIQTQKPLFYPLSALNEEEETPTQR
jgi:hypothetical protein